MTAFGGFSWCCCEDDDGPGPDPYDPVSCSVFSGGTAPGAWELIYPSGLGAGDGCLACPEFEGTWILLPTTPLFGAACAWGIFDGVDCETGVADPENLKFHFQARLSGSTHFLDVRAFIYSGGVQATYWYRYQQSGQFNPASSYVIPLGTVGHGRCGESIPLSVTVNPL